MFRTVRLSLLVLTLAALFLPASTSLAGTGTESAEAAPRPLVYVNDFAITDADLLERYEHLRSAARGAAKVGVAVPEPSLQALLPKLMDEKLLLMRADELPLDPKPVIESGINAFMHRFDLQGQAELENFLEEKGMTRKELEESIVRGYVPALVLAREGRMHAPAREAEVEMRLQSAGPGVTREQMRTALELERTARAENAYLSYLRTRAEIVYDPQLLWILQEMEAQLKDPAGE